MRTQKKIVKTGFTLVEVMISLAIIIFLGMSLMTAHVAARSSMHSARINLEVTEALRSSLEAEKAKDYDAVVSVPAAAYLISDAGTADLTDDLNGMISTTVTTNGDGTKTIVANLTWEQKVLGGMADRDRSLITMIADV